jgi:5-oxoprolinase (ATP-hydrolysing) subunit A
MTFDEPDTKSVYIIFIFCYHRAVEKSVDINCDMGESFGPYRMGNDEAVLSFITSANVACGFHGSDPVVMARTVALCKKYRVRVGAHPGYPDLLGFGRRQMDVEREELKNYVLYQTGALIGFLSLSGLALQHVKLHGALYNYMVRQEGEFIDLITTLKAAFGDIIFLTLGTTKANRMKKACGKKGLRIALEAFPDRNYTDEGELLPRSKKEAVLKDPELIAKRAVTMAREHGIESVNGRWIDMDVDTLCIHGDNAESLAAAGTIRDHLKKAAIRIKPLSQILT